MTSANATYGVSASGRLRLTISHQMPGTRSISTG